MDIVDARTAREFVQAWAGESALRRAGMLRSAHEGQSANAGMDHLYGRKSAERKARAAMTVLHRAERQALCEVLGWSTECVATTAELWEEVRKKERYFA